jgi:hypothetical protein
MISFLISLRGPIKAGCVIWQRISHGKRGKVKAETGAGREGVLPRVGSKTKEINRQRDRVRCSLFVEIWVAGLGDWLGYF